MALKIALQSYVAARGLITPDLDPLVVRELLTIQESIAEAFDATSGSSNSSTKRCIRWYSKGLAYWIAVLNEHVSQFK